MPSPSTKLLPTDLLRGTLELLILKTLSKDQMHGWGIAQSIEKVSRNQLQVGQGSLYPALQRLERDGCIQATWGFSDNNRRAKYYTLSRKGKKQLEIELKNWSRLTTAITQILEKS